MLHLPLAPAEAEQLLRRLCAELREQLVAGGESGARELLARHPDLAEEPEAALELIYTEFALREELDRQLAPEEWRSRFPRWADRLERLFQVHHALAEKPAADTAHSAATRVMADDTAGGIGLDGPRLCGQRTSRYVIGEQIGRGGMGIVFKARQEGLNRLVALKMILAGEFALRSERVRFLKEAQAAARLQHPHIVQVFDVGELDGQPYLAMEYLSGGTLAQRLAKGPLHVADAARLLEVLARAMDYAHCQGVIHRDLKPGNILLTGAETSRSADRDEHALCAAKIADFGLAKLCDYAASAAAQEATGRALGTPGYMAPEQIEGPAQQIGPASDVYALGAILYEALTGRPPFCGESPLATMQQVLSLDPVPPSRLQPRVPRDLETICLKCLQKESSRRYPSAGALADDLGRFRDGRPIVARPTGLCQRIAKWARRRPGIAALVAVVFAALVGLTLLAWEVVAARQASLLASHSAEREREAAAVSEAEARIMTAHRQWLDGEFALARRTLDDVPAAYRSQLWKYLDRALAAEVRVLPWPQEALIGASELALSGEGRLVAARTRELVCVWDAPLDQTDLLPTHRIENTDRKTHSFAALAFNADEQLVLTQFQTRNAPFPTRLMLFDAASGRQHSAREYPSLVADVSGDGRVFARCDGAAIVIGDTATGAEWRTLAVHFHRTMWLRLSYDGGLVAAQTGPSRLDLWNTADGSTAGRLECPGSGIGAVRFAPRAALVAAGLSTIANAKSAAVVWDLRRGERPIASRSFSSDVKTLAFHPSGEQLAVGLADCTVVVVNPRTGREILTLRGHRGSLSALAFSRDGTLLASAANDRTVRLWDAQHFCAP